jgi:hypothetical protein
MTQAAIFTYGKVGANPLPYAPITLKLGSTQLKVSALVDSGATINVLPYQVGLQLGAIWEQQTTPLRLAGNLALSEARALVVDALIEDLPPVRLAFAWTQNQNVPVILGQTNFFLEFDVNFLGSQTRFEIRSKST